MQITELLRLTKWFQLTIVKSGIPTKYTALYNKMNQNLRRQNTQQTVAFETERDSLIKAIKQVTFQQLSLEQIDFLDKQGIVDLLGSKGVSKIEDVLYKNNLDIATATNKIKEYSDLFTKAQNTIQEISDTLGKHFKIDEKLHKPEKSVVMRVYFQNNVSINNLTDLKKLSAAWYEIGRGIAMAQDKSPEDFNIIGAKNGSIVIEMAVVVGIAASVSKILLEALKVADRVLELLKKVEEIKSLKLKNKQIENELKKEADKEREDGIKTIVEASIEEFELKRDEQGDKIVALEKSIKKLIEFTQNGGNVDFTQPDESEYANDDQDNIREEVVKLKENIKNIRLLEQSLKVLEEKTKKN